VTITPSDRMMKAPSMGQNSFTNSTMCGSKMFRRSSG
jgi:hypothetical protein